MMKTVEEGWFTDAENRHKINKCDFSWLTKEPLLRLYFDHSSLLELIGSHCKNISIYIFCYTYVLDFIEYKQTCWPVNSGLLSSSSIGFTLKKKKEKKGETFHVQPNLKFVLLKKMEGKFYEFI